MPARPASGAWMDRLPPDVREKVVAMGFEIEDSSPEKFQAAYRKEMPVWEKLVKQTGAKVE